MTPFACGKRPPPHAVVLRSLSKHARRLGLTAVAPGAGVPVRNGWHEAVPTAPVRATAPAVAVVVPEKGALEVYVGKGARCFTRG